MLGAGVSLYGLWGFAADTAQLPLLFRIGFIAVWDVAELTSFFYLYRAARVEGTWTPSMLKTRTMAWRLVAGSAAMNFFHAPGGLLGAITLAAIPVVSAKLVEHGLERMLETNAGKEVLAPNPGPVRLVQLCWLHLWSRVFASLGLDAGSADGRVPAEARVRRAAARINDLARSFGCETRCPTMRSAASETAPRKE